MKDIVWNVYYHNINRGEIRVFNVFEHVGFQKDVMKYLHKCTEKGKFTQELRRSLFYYFGGKCEWEIIIKPWCGGQDTKEIKVDVYKQIMNNWDVFADYVWNLNREP